MLHPFWSNSDLHPPKMGTFSVSQLLHTVRIYAEGEARRYIRGRLFSSMLSLKQSI
jgi:hypothetical protein